MSESPRHIFISFCPDTNNFYVDLYKEIYHRDAVLKALYKFTDEYYVKLAPQGELYVRAMFEAKPGGCVECELAAKKFCNEALDQQIREDLLKENGRVRDIIFEHAFNPIKGLSNAIL